MRTLLLELPDLNMKPEDTQGQCHYCGVTITEQNYTLREVRAINELGDAEPCCDDCSRATEIKELEDL